MTTYILIALFFFFLGFWVCAMVFAEMVKKGEARVKIDGVWRGKKEAKGSGTADNADGLID